MQNNEYFYLRKIQEIEEIVLDFLEKKSVTGEKMLLLKSKIVVLRVALKNKIFDKK